MSYIIINYFFFFLLLLSSFLAILSRNPVQSILFLILSFLIVAIIFILLGAEFLALLITIIYIGAISILFLFVIMMLNLKVVESYNIFYKYLPIGAFIGLIFISILFFLIINNLEVNFYLYPKRCINWIILIDRWTNIVLIGQVLYNNFLSFFFISILILFVSMIGCIVMVIDINEKRTSIESSIMLNQKLKNWKFYEKKI